MADMPAQTPDLPIEAVVPSTAPCPDDPAPCYYGFVLRLWRDNAAAPWHASLQAADGTARIGFAEVEQLLAYIRGLAAPPADGHAPTDA